MTKAQVADQQQAIDRLRDLLKPGDTVYTIQRHVSRSGMMRHISVVRSDAEPREITHLVAQALQERRADDGGMKIGGCGMDMGFEVVYRLGLALFPDGFTCVGDHCPAADHANGDRNYEPHHHERFQGGYALRQRWL
jgi:hypothetical protein